MRVGVVQLNGSADPIQNLDNTVPLIRDAASAGATLIATPEVTNIIGADRETQWARTYHQANDPFLKTYQKVARELSIWLSLGSFAMHHDTSGKLVNRSFLIAPDGSIAATYDKIHMFDVTLSDTETYCESAQFTAGDRAVVAAMDDTILGLSICYDLRFPNLYQDLARAGAQILLIPCAFTKPSGVAHFETLLRARAIETGCFVIAACQTGHHGRRETYGHSMIVDPWGEVVLNAGIKPGFFIADLDRSAVSFARTKIPNLSHIKEYIKP